MFRPTHSSSQFVSRRLFAFIAVVLIVLAATPACTRSNASSDKVSAASALPFQPAQAQPAKAQLPQPSVDSTSGLAELQEKAQSGDSNAMYRLGRLYATGSGVPRDQVEAFDWYKRAAARGNAEAMYSLGEAYEHGTGVREDVQRAVNWYHDAARRGNQPARAALARLGESIEDHD